uniref:Reverse transcriptase domain-containing protein n=1 Tax=Tanacetum cinerariifolium TaxID=118510 RepID=A0A6L2M417_TANCI|nr:reverse transcriptase domain-containing protein [Tanacetum cinerariifolium]
MRTRSQSRENFPQQEASPAIVEPLCIENPFLEDQFQEDPPKDPPEVPMTDDRTMKELLRAPTEGYEDAIVILEIAANNFGLKHGLNNLVQNKQFFGHEKEDPRAHIRYFNKITSTMRVPNQRFDESFYEAWERFNDLLRARPHQGFSELHQLDTFYNALNINDQDSLNSAVGGNFLDKMPRECLKIIESKSKVRQTRAKAVVAKVSTSSSTPAISSDVAELKDMVRALLLDKKNQSSAPASSLTPTPVKVVEPNCVTCGGQFHRPHVNQPPAYQALAYQAPIPQTQSVSKTDFKNYVKANDAVMRNMQNQGQNLQIQMANLTDMLSKFVSYNTASSSGSGTLPSNTVTNPKEDLKELSLSELTLTYMTLELVDRSVSKLIGIAKDDSVKVGVFHFPADFMVVDFEPDPRVPLILERDFLLFEEADAFLGLEDDPNSPEFNPSYYDPKGDILLLKAILNSEPFPPLPNHDQYLPLFKKELKEKTTFTCPYGTFAYRRMPFGLYNAPGTFQRCMLAIFHDMVEKTMEVFIDNFSVFRNSFENCLSHLDKMLQRCEDTNLSLNWEKSHFMVKEGIVLGHKISKNGIEVDKAKVDIIAKLPHPTTVKGENRASWSDKLDDALWAFRIAYKTPIECTPYKLVYGKACHLLIELEHKAYWVLKQAKFDLAIVGDYCKVQLNKLNELRDHAYENSLI